MASTAPPKDFDRLREAFQHRFEGLSPHLRRIAQYALGDPNRFALQTVAETARQSRRPAIHPHPVREGVRLLGLLRDAAGVPAAPDRGRAVISGPDSRASRQVGGGGRGRSVRHPARVRRRVGGGSRPSQGGHRRRCTARSGSHDGRREGDLRHRAAQGRFRSPRTWRTASSGSSTGATCWTRSAACCPSRWRPSVATTCSSP